MLQMYSMYDNKAEIYNKPIYVKNWEELNEALDLTLKEDNGNKINPVDYDIFHMGEYDTSTGAYELFEAPKHMINLNHLKG